MSLQQGSGFDAEFSSSSDDDELEYQMDAEFVFQSKMVAAFRKKVEVAETECAPYMAAARKYHARFESRLDYEAEQFIRPLEEGYDRRVQPYVDRAVAKVDAKLEERRRKKLGKAEAKRKVAAALELEEMRSGAYKFYIGKELEDSDPLHAAATLINAGARGFIGRRKFAVARMQADQDELMRAVRTCQRCVRRVIYLHVTRPDRMATVLQARWRGYRTRAWWTTWKPKQILERRNAAATKIQGAYRGLIKRREFSFAIFGAKQEALSQGLLTKRVRKSRALDSLPRWKKDTEAATRIQRMLRARKNRSNMMVGLKRKMRRDAAKARTAAVLESEAAELLMAQQGSEVTIMQAAGKGWLTVVRSQLEVAAANDKDLTEIMLKPDRGGRTPLHVACINGHLKVVEELVSEWAGSLDVKKLVCAEDNAGRTPLHMAASGSKVKCAKFIIATGYAPLKIAAFDGRTALHAAAVASCQPMAQLLFENSPWLLKQEDAAGCTALDIAQEINPESSLCSFLEHCHKYGATWKVIEWVDPFPLDDILDVDPGPIGDTGWTLYYTEENDQYFYHEETKSTTWDEPEAVSKVFEEMEKQQKLDRVWDKVDVDGNGWLDRDELKAVLLLLGKSEDEIDIDATMSELDEDGNQEVCKDEFAPWYFALGNDALSALAKAEKQEKKKAKGDDAVPWKCDVCTTMNRPRADNCQLCGRDKGASLAQPEPEIVKPKPKLSKGVLNVMVLEASGLKSMDFFGKNDPYCTIKIGGITKRCSSIEGGGADPRWGFGEGELVPFEFRRKPHQMEAKAWDEDEHDDDDCIGTGWVMLDEQEELEPWSMNLWFPIRDQKGEITGRLHFSLEWIPDVKIYGDDLLEEILASSETGQKVLKQQQERKLKQMWKQIDDDGSGELDATELKKVMLLMGRDEKKLDMQRVMAAIDKDRSGSVSFSEFELWWDKQDKEMQEQLQSKVGAEPEPEPEPEPELEQATLTLNVMEARKLKKMDRLGDNDPYVTIKVPQWNREREVWSDGVLRRTTTLAGGGSACAWGFGRGEPLAFEQIFKIPPRIDVSAFDEDQADADDHIGTGFIKLGANDELATWEVDEWIPILEKAGRKTTGEVRVVASWVPVIKKPEKPLLGKMTVTLYEATDLKSVDTFGSNDVYARVTTAGQEKKTCVLPSAGSTAKWGTDGEKLGFDVSLFRDAFPPATIKVDLLDENTGQKDLLIGSYSIELEHKSNDASLRLEKNWYDILDNQKKAAGLVQLDVEWIPDPDNEKPPEEKEPVALVDGSLKVTVLEAADLKQMDRLGMNDVYVRVTVSGKEKRTSTCNAEHYADRGEPQWNEGKGDTLSYRVRRLLLPTTLQIIAMDEDKDADDHIGTGFITVGEEMLPQLMKNDWMLDSWVDIKSNKGKTTGRVRAQISWKPKVYSRKELAKRAAEEEQSKLEQVWKTVDVNFDGFLDASELKQVLELMGMAEVDIDMGSIMAEIDVDRSGEVDWDEFAVWWEKQEQERREGAVKAARAAVLRPAGLTAQVLSARKLKRMDVKGNDVYCVVAPATVDPWRTTTIYSAQHTGTPIWPKGEDCTWDFEANKEMPARVTLSVFDEDKHDADDLIGEVEVDMSELARDSEWQIEDWYTLQSNNSAKKRKPKAVGQVQMRLSWVPREKSKDELRLEAERELFAAVVADDPHALRLLLARGVDPHCRNSMGMTAIELATERRKRKALSYLQKRISAPDVPDPATDTTSTSASNARPPSILPAVVTPASSSTGRPGPERYEEGELNSSTRNRHEDSLPRLQ